MSENDEKRRRNEFYIKYFDGEGEKYRIHIKIPFILGMVLMITIPFVLGMVITLIYFKYL